MKLGPGSTLTDVAIEVDDALRRAGCYVHPMVPFVVEFPPGPLGIGEDYQIRPVWKRRRRARMLALSATDSCRDRLAAFYHWKDRRALAAAVAIAMRERIALSKVKQRSAAEGHPEAYDRFVAELALARRARRIGSSHRARTNK